MNNDGRNVLIDDIDIPDLCKDVLIENGYKTIGDLISGDIKRIERKFNIIDNKILDGKEAFRQLKILLHYKYKVVLKGEFDDIGLNPQMAVINVFELNLPSQVVYPLVRQFDIKTLGDIFSIDYKDIIKARGFGENSLKILRDYVHSLGLTLKNEEPLLEEVLAFKRKEGAKVIEDVIDDSKLCKVLYKNRIYTIEELQEFGPNVFKLAGLGDLKRKKLKEMMEENNLTFKENKKDSSIDLSFMPTKEEIEKIRIENEVIKEEIRKKESLLAEYESLLKERQILLKKNEELDYLIESKKNKIEGEIIHGRK